MERRKYCCEGQNAVIFAPLWPVKRDKVKYYTAVYLCNKCHSYTLRGETNQKKDHTTFIDWISENEAIQLSKEKAIQLSLKRSKTNGVGK